MLTDKYEPSYEISILFLYFSSVMLCCHVCLFAANGWWHHQVEEVD